MDDSEPVTAAADQDPSSAGVPSPEFMQLQVCALIPMADNPQEQDSEVFGQLVKSIRAIGLAETVLVSGPFQDLPECPTHGSAHPMYKIVGGHHKVDGAKIAGATEVPCMVLPQMSDDDIMVWVVRMNVIRGRLNPWKFTRMFNNLARKYDPSVLRAKMGITSETAWKSLYKDVRKSLPPELARRLDAVRSEVHDVESLAVIIKRIFSEHGEQLNCRFLVFEYGGQSHVLLKMSKRASENLDRICTEAVEKKLDLNRYMNVLLEQHLPNEMFTEALEQQAAAAGGLGV